MLEGEFYASNPDRPDCSRFSPSSPPPLPALSHPLRRARPLPRLLLEQLFLLSLRVPHHPLRSGPVRLLPRPLSTGPYPPLRRFLFFAPLSGLIPFFGGFSSSPPSSEGPSPPLQRVPLLRSLRFSRRVGTCTAEGARILAAISHFQTIESAGAFAGPLHTTDSRNCSGRPETSSGELGEASSDGDSSAPVALSPSTPGTPGTPRSPRGLE